MSNDWGKPFTPEEVAKINNDGWGKPVPTNPNGGTMTGRKDWAQTAHDEWEKIAPDTSPFAGSKVTLTFPDVSANPPWLAPTPVNSVGSYYAEDGTLMNADGTRSIFDDIDAGPDGDPWEGRKDWTAPDINGDAWPEPLTTDDPEHPDCVAPYVERTAPVETFSEADGPWYVVYFGPILYTVLAGPYDTQEAAAERIDRVWAQFEHDAAYDYSFPKRERSGLRATTVRTVFNLKGAYGKQ